MIYTQKLKRRAKGENFKENRTTELATYALFPNVTTYIYNLLVFFNLQFFIYHLSLHYKLVFCSHYRVK